MARKKVDRKDKKCHREFVWLAESEYEHLCSLLGKPEVERLIGELNLYIGSKGDKYVSHYYTIQMWAKRNAKKTETTVMTNTIAAADANILINALRKYRAMPPDIPAAIADRFRRMCGRIGTTWPKLHDELNAGRLTNEQVWNSFLKS